MTQGYAGLSTPILIAAMALAACSGPEASGETAPGENTALITWTAATTEGGICRPEARAEVNKAATGLYKIHGETDYVDTVTGEMTEIPMQYLFRGADIETGLSSDRAIVGLNTDTACGDLRVVQTVKYCLYDDDRRAEVPCRQEIEVAGEGFAALELLREDGRAQD